MSRPCSLFSLKRSEDTRYAELDAWTSEQPSLIVFINLRKYFDCHPPANIPSTFFLSFVASASSSTEFFHTSLVENSKVCLSLSCDLFFIFSNYTDACKAVPPMNRTDCGYLGIDQKTCEDQRLCCYDSKDYGYPTKHCFYDIGNIF